MAGATGIFSFIQASQNTHVQATKDTIKTIYAGFSLRIEVAGEYYKTTGESDHSERKLTSSFYRLMKFSQKIPCSSRRILRSPMLNEHPVYDIVHVLNFLAIHFIDVVTEVFTIYFLTVTITVKKSADVFVKLVS